VFLIICSLSFLFAWISDHGEGLGEGGPEQVDEHAFDLNIGA
jgi:hypothetical protein